MTRLAIFLALLVYSPVFAKDGRQLSTAEIHVLFSGATMRGAFVADGSAWAERTTKSGRVLDLTKGGRQVGAWSAKDDRICYVYFGNPPSMPCYAITMEGEAIWFRDADRGAVVARAVIDDSSRR